jgi:hypothetical protein
MSNTQSINVECGLKNNCIQSKYYGLLNTSKYNMMGFRIIQQINVPVKEAFSIASAK